MRYRPAAFNFILVTLLIDMIGIGLIIPVWPELVRIVGHANESSAAYTMGLMMALFAAMQFLFSPILGSLSDQYGRRPVLLLSLLGGAIDYLLMAFAPTLGLLFVGRVVSGITAANITAANAYIADVTPPEDRAKRFGMVGAVFGIGFVVGPVLGGWLGLHGPRVPFYAAALLSGLNFLYGLFVLPESLAPENRRQFTWRRANPVSSLGALARYPVVLDLAFGLVCFNTAMQGLQAVWVLYTEHRFDWSSLQVGFSLAVVGIVVGISQAGLVGTAVKRYGEKRVLIVSLLVGTLSYLLYGLATQGWMMYAILALGLVSSMSGPVIQAIVSKQVAADEQGAIQGALASLTSVTAVFAPIVATWLFGYFTARQAPVQLPGISFFVGSALSALGTILVMRALPVAKAVDPSQVSEETQPVHTGLPIAAPDADVPV